MKVSLVCGHVAINTKTESMYIHHDWSTLRLGVVPCSPSPKVKYTAKKDLGKMLCLYWPNPAVAFMGVEVL